MILSTRTPASSGSGRTSRDPLTSLCPDSVSRLGFRKLVASSEIRSRTLERTDNLTLSTTNDFILLLPSTPFALVVAVIPSVLSPAFALATTLPLSYLPLCPLRNPPDASLGRASSQLPSSRPRMSLKRICRSLHAYKTMKESRTYPPR